MIKKLVNLIKNYDTIMKMVEDYDKKVPTKPTKKNKAYSMFNVPQTQKDYIMKKLGGEE